MKVIEAILAYIAEKKVITFVVLAAMMIGLLAVVCVTAVFVSKTDTSDNSHLAEVLSDNNRNTREYIHFDFRKWENPGALSTFEGLV